MENTRTLVGTDATTNDQHNGKWQLRRHPAAIIARPPLALLVVLGLFAVSLLGLFGRLTHADDVSHFPIRASGDTVYRWQVGQAQASLLEGDCVVQHEGRSIRAKSVLMVSDGPRGTVRTRIVIDGMVLADGRHRSEPTALTLMTNDDPEVQSPRYRGVPKETPNLIRYLPAAESDASNHNTIQQVQLQQQTIDSGLLESNPGDGTSVLENPVLAPAQGVDLLTTPSPTTFSDGATTRGTQFFVGGGTRSVEIIGRGGTMPPEGSSINRPEIGETVLSARGGVTVLVRDVSAQLPGGQLIELGTVSLSADRIVAWMPLVTDLLSGNTDFSQSDGEIYLEGDIVFRQGQRIIYAERMYYNVAQERGVVLDAEAIMTIPEYQGIVRLKADVLQQIAKGNFRAFDAAVTTSRLGVPRYWLQSDQLTLTDRTRTTTDPVTGRPVLDSEPFAKSANNFVYFGGVPILYWPRFSTSLERPAYYLSGVDVLMDDRSFGSGVTLEWDLFQLLGIESAPKGVDWELSTDYLSKRGPALGTKFKYRLPGLLGIPGPVNGLFDSWLIDDRGQDRLGGDRLSVDPEATTRGRSLLRHRQYLPNGFEFIAEIGWLSDRNFLEQYIENEWDRDVDHTTGLRLRNYYYNHLFDVSANVQVNDFYTETENLPSLDHYLLGGSLLGNRLTWSAHNRATYAKLNVADEPTNGEQALQSNIPGESNRKGLIASTRQELALPLSTGPFRIVPFISGEAAHYGEAEDGESLTRLLGQTGVRASLPMTRIDPTIQSSLLNVRGLAHKLEWTAEYFYADSDTNLDELPLYDALDDNAQEQFRRRFITSLYGSSLPMESDPRYYALRHGLQRWVTSPSDTIADDLQQFRLGLHQRFQTKRGLPGRERIVDLLQFDVDLLLFPDATRDNFGETVGPTIYAMRYHIGDRFTVLSDGYFDFFTNGLRSVSAGVRSSRPGVGDWYVGLLSLEGPISSTVLRSSMDYRLNEKWIFSGATTYDFGQTGNVGQSFGVTRVGESLLVRLGLNVDSGRNNESIAFSIEPRFWPSQRLGRIGGALIPPPGVEGLE